MRLLLNLVPGPPDSPQPLVVRPVLTCRQERQVKLRAIRGTGD